jgi:hypothetical protein
MIRAISALVFLVAFASAFTSTRMTIHTNKRTIMSMNAWGSQQKIGQSVITTTAPKPHHDDVKPDIRRPARGSGFDERADHASIEEVSRSVSAIDRSFRQRSLLMNMEGDIFGSAEKIERVRLAGNSAILEGPSKVRSVSAGGLMKDWDFDFGN